MKIMITGGLGFMGSNFARHLLEERLDYELVIYDALTYAGRIENVRGIKEKVKLITKDLKEKHALYEAAKDVDVIYHFAAESHVDRSIKNPESFITSNILGTFNLLEASRKNDVNKFIYISSSEVYGTALEIPMSENHPLNPHSPYAATKLAADRLCYSYYKTYGLPVLILRPFDNYGPRQFPEKLIPFFTLRALHNLPLPVYGDGLYARDYLYVFDFCEAAERAMHNNAKGEVINMATGKDFYVIDIANMILEYLKRPKSLIVHVEDRLGHVRRLIGTYEKAKKLLDWEPQVPFEEGLKKTINWYLDNEWWWKPLSRQFIESSFPRAIERTLNNKQAKEP